MNITVKPRLLKVLLFFIITSIIVVSLALMIYLKSDSFTGAVEAVIQARIERPVEIGSISLVSGNRIVISEFVIGKSAQDDMHIVLPRVEIDLSISGLLNGTIDEVILENPKVVLNLSKRKKSAAGRRRVSLPFTLERGLLSKGEVELIFDNESSLHMRSVTISIEKDDKRSTIRAGALLSEPNATVTMEAGIDMEEMRIERVEIDVSEVSLRRLSDLDLIPAPPKSEISGLVSLSAYILREGRASADILDWNSVVTVKDFSMTSESLKVSFADGPVRFKGNGRIYVEDGRIEINALQTQFPRLKPWTLHGMIENIYSGDPVVDLEFNTGDIPFSEVKRIVSGPAVEFLHEMLANGYGGADAAISGTVGSPRAEGALHVSGDEFKKGNIMVSSFRADAPFVYKDKTMTLNNASLKTGGVTTLNADKEGVKYGLNDLELLIPYLEYTYPEGYTALGQFTIGKAVIHGSGKDYYKDKNIVMTAALDSNPDEKRIMLNDILIRTNSIERVTARASINFNKPAVMDLDFKFRHFDVDKPAQKFFHAFLNGKGITLDGTGEFHASVAVIMPEQGAVRVSGRTNLVLENAGFSTADERTVCEGMDLKISNRFKFSLPPDTIDFTLNAGATGFELLTGRFYGSFQDRLLQINAGGKYMISDDSLHIADLSLGLTGIGAMTVSGEILNLSELPYLNADIRLENISNNEVYNFFVRETFQEQLPFLSRFELHGITSAGLSVKGTSEEFTAKGNLYVKDMEILNESEMSVTGINVSLPLDITYPETTYRGDAESFGVIKIKKFIRKDLQFTDLELFPAVRRNALVFKEDIVLPMLGGDIVLKNIVYADIPSPERALGLSIEIKDIDLLDASALLELPAFTGTLSGNIPKVSFIRNRLYTEGEILLELFGGKIKISGLSVDNVFSPIASMKSTVELEGIDLGKLTGVFDFGHISGVIRGRVENLVIVNGQAENFEASVETVRKKGITQKINVKALKKISILGTGSSSSILDMGIYRFFKEYRYKKLGFSASLRNDNLFLVGVENKDNVGYLVVGGVLPPKVDVITYNQNISFREIVNRLKRINRTGD